MNLNTYTTEMSKSIWDKAFFMDKIPGVKCVIDFGCADGAMVHFLAPLFPDIMFVGYDISSELIDRARHTAPYYANRSSSPMSWEWERSVPTYRRHHNSQYRSSV